MAPSRLLDLTRRTTFHDPERPCPFVIGAKEMARGGKAHAELFRTRESCKATALLVSAVRDNAENRRPLQGLDATFPPRSFELVDQSRRPA